MAASINSPDPSLVIAAGAAWPLLCTVAVILRFIGSRVAGDKFHVDDWMTVPALLLLWGQGLGLIIGTAKHSLGYPDPDPPPGIDPDTYSSPQSILSRQLFYGLLLMQIPGLTFIKLSFVFFYRRFFVGRRGDILDVTLNALIVLLIAWAIAFFFSELFICGTNFEDIWISKSTVERSAACVQLVLYDEALTSSDFILDLLVLLIPIYPLLQLRLALATRLGLIGVFSLGIFAVAASLTRFVVFVDEENLTFTVCLYWTLLESGIALLAACLPSIFGLCNNVRRNAMRPRPCNELRKGLPHGQRMRLNSSATTVSAEKGALTSSTGAAEADTVPLTDLEIGRAL